MFEGLVRQLILGYLGQYIRDIQQEQLKITLWNEEVLLENVELILEAFDYLQLPFALKHGRVGKLSIKIPWKKLGWDPIIIILEDVFVSACQREDMEWSMDAIERREFAGKKAKLAAAELAKLSRRVCDNRAGNSFISYITAKILDGIQVSIRNVHVLYRDMLTASAVTIFGMKFSGLTISRQNLLGFSGGKVRGGQVNKLIEVQGLEFYCRTLQGTLDLMGIDSSMDSKYQSNARTEDGEYVHMLSPLDVIVSLSVNRSGKLDNDSPQYYVNVESTNLAVSLDEVQLQQILTLCDYFSTCRMREKYGRYRPWWSPLGKKLGGWQIAWWHYAQESVLSDVRKRLKRTSWKYLGERLNQRLKYVSLYKTKLKCLQQDQAIDEYVLRELEEMEKLCDIDEILSYRSTAERELKDLLMTLSSSRGSNGANIDVSFEDERPSSKPRGWLNWLSRGMLGAGGTDDSSQFSGVISDDVIKDIYEATKFHPAPALNADAATTVDVFLSSIKLNINQISFTLRSTRLGCAVARLMLDTISVECKIWDGSTGITATVGTAQLLNPLNDQVILCMIKINCEENECEVQPSLSIQVELFPLKVEVSSSVKVILQPVQVTFDTKFLTDILEYFYILGSFKFPHERVLLSVNDIDDVQTRLLSKIDYVLLNRKRMMWDVKLANLLVTMPWVNTNFEEQKMVVELGALTFKSNDQRSYFASDLQENSYRRYLGDYLSSSCAADDFTMGFQLGDFYDYYELNVNNCEVHISMPRSTESIPLFEKFSCSVNLASCIIPDEPLLKGLDVSISISSLLFHFSPSIYSCIMGLIANFSKLHHLSEYADLNSVNALHVKSNGLMTSEFFWLSLTANLESVSFKVDLENEVENGYSLMLSVQTLDVSFDLKEFLYFWMSTEGLQIVAYPRRNEESKYLLWSSGVKSSTESSSQDDKDFKLQNQNENSDDKNSSADRCLHLHFESYRDLESTCNKCVVCLSNLDIHCYPFIVGLLVGFIDKILKLETSIVLQDSLVVNGKTSFSRPYFDFEKYGFSNFVEMGSSECASIPLDNFPFTTICNSGPFVAFETLDTYAIPHWRKAINFGVPKTQRHKFSFKKGSRHYSHYLKNLQHIADTLWKNSNSNTMFNAELNLSSIRLHFHDSTCVVGTISLATCKSSISVSGDCFDMLCSSEGLVLSSSWWSQTIEGFLWGPLLPNLSPILNIRARKELTGTIELSFGLQHVSCTLPPEFLAVIIGYFSSPDWSWNSEDKPITCANSECINSEVSSSTFYNFEILDSNLLVPVGQDGYQFLKLDIQQLLGCFIANSDFGFVLKEIPHECLVVADKISNRNHCLNLFGRDLSLIVVHKKDDLFDSSSLDQLPGHKKFTLASSFSADVWVRFPLQCEWYNAPLVYPTSIMATIINCQLNAGEAWTICGFEALVDIINQFSLVGKESELFKSDVLEFLQSRRRMEEDKVLSPEVSAVTSTEIRLCVRSMSIKLHCLKGVSTVSELLAEIEMQFMCSASFMDENPCSVNISLSYVTLFSSLNSVMLVECPSSSSSSSTSEMTLSVSDQGENKLLVSLPCIDVWMHMFDWRQIIVLLDYYQSQTSKITDVDALSKNTHAAENVAIAVQSPNTSSSFSSGYRRDGAIYSSLKLERVGITTYIPVQVNRDIFSKLEEPKIQNQRPYDFIHGNQHGFVVLALQSRCSEMVSDGKNLILTIKLEKVDGVLELYKDNTPRSWSLFELFQVNLEAEIYHQTEDTRSKIDFHCDSTEIWLSNDIICFLHCMLFEVPETGPSQFMFGHIDFNIQLRKLSILLTDAKWSSCGPLVEILMRNLLFSCNITQSEMEGSVGGDLQANYNNIDKVLWEPFVEPWKFQLSISRKQDKSSLLNGAIMTHIHLKSVSQLNLNLTESLIEVIFRTTELIKDVCALPEITACSTSSKLSDSQINGILDTRRYAPYILQNLTSLPLVFYVCEGELGEDDKNAVSSRSGCFLQAGSSVPIYVDETPKKQLFPDRPAQSSERNCGKKVIEAAHRFIIIQLEGTSTPSAPISMDLVGVRYFEADFSKPNTKSEIGDGGDNSTCCKRVEGDGSTDIKSGFIIPVVVDVSVQRYTKLLRLYSTVVFSNATSVPLEVRFDIPFGVSPKILDPIYPGKEFPLPLHLAEAGRMRWRPLGDTYLWSEAYNVSNIVSLESRINLLRSFVCYPSHPSSDAFRCCISVDDRCLPTVSGLKNSSPGDNSVKPYIRSSKKQSNDIETSKKRFMHLVTLTSPLVLRNYLLGAVSLSIENAGVRRSTILSKVETSFVHIDSSHDLTLTFSIQHFKPAILKFPRAEIFSAMAKFSGTKFSLSETLTFDSELTDGPLSVTMEKIMDPFSGAREISISVPFLIYNCIGFPLVLSNSVNEIKGHSCVVSSCYHLGEHDKTLGSKDGLSLLFSSKDFNKAPRDTFPAKGSVRNRNDTKSHDSKFSSKPLYQHGPSKLFHEMADSDAGRSSIYTLKDKSSSSRQLSLGPDMKSPDFVGIHCKKADACMYSPGQISTSGDIIVRLSRCLSDTATKNISSSLWSSPFLLVPPTGSTSVIVPQLCTNAGYLVSVSAVAAPFSGRTKIITFQPRYVVSNACSRDLFYKQKGTERIFLLEAGRHSHVHCTDITRELLVCVRFHEPGWQWSGCFSPEHLGDTQVKMWNYISGAVNMMRVEVQSADVSIEDEKIVGSPHGNSGTNLILLSDDDTGFMPYRIDNFSKERLRIYQQRCETFETMIHSYASHPYAWDEPCFPHRLTVEVLGERIIGLYTLDDVKDHSPVYLPATSEKPERTLLVSVHSEGAIKVLSIVDSNYHVLNYFPTSGTPPFKLKPKDAQKCETFVLYNERILVDIPFIGISLMNSYQEELLFACAKNSRFDFTQSVDQQKFCFNSSFLQIDNQLPSTPYPVILSFDHCYKGNKDNRRKITSAIQIDSNVEPVIYLSVAKWRTKNLSLVSFEHINLRVTDFHLELEQDLVLSLFKFFKNVSLRFQTRVLQQIDSTLYPSFSNPGIIHDASAHIQDPVTISYHEECRSSLFPPVIPIGAPWQQIHLLARKQKKIYVELLDLAPIKMTLSFSSSPWLLRNGMLTLGESLIHRGFMALADVEGAQIHLKELVLSHQLASWESIQEILIRHYTRQSLHEMYKVFGSAGLIGNPMGFARSLSLGLKDFISVPVQSVFQSPVGLLTGMAQGTTSLLSNTIYAITDAATQFSRAAHKGIVAFALDDENVEQMEKQPKGIPTTSKGVINEFLEGLTGLLQSPVQGAEKHGLPGVLSGIALGVTGLVAKPAASILEITGKTAQSIRNRSKVPHVGSQRFRVRLPRPLSGGFALKPYSWEEAVGTAVLRDADNGERMRDEILVMCKALRQGGKFVIITEKYMLVVSCSSLVDLGKPNFQGVPANPEWVIEAEIGMDSVIHANVDEYTVHIVGNSVDTFMRPSQHQHKHGQGSWGKRWNNARSPLPLFQTNLEFACKEDAEDLLHMLLSMIEKGKDQGWGRTYILHQSNLR